MQEPGALEVVTQPLDGGYRRSRDPMMLSAAYRAYVLLREASNAEARVCWRRASRSLQSGRSSYDGTTRSTKMDDLDEIRVHVATTWRGAGLDYSRKAKRASAAGLLMRSNLAFPTSVRDPSPLIWCIRASPTIGFDDTIQTLPLKSSTSKSTLAFCQLPKPFKRGTNW